jgi:hypothetical protein
MNKAIFTGALLASTYAFTLSIAYAQEKSTNNLSFPEQDGEIYAWRVNEGVMPPEKSFSEKYKPTTKRGNNQVDCILAMSDSRKHKRIHPIHVDSACRNK